MLVQSEVRHHPTQRAFVSAVQTDDSQENHGDEDGTRQKPNEPGGSHVSSEEDRRRRHETISHFTHAVK